MAQNETGAESSHFIRTRIDEDLENKKYPGVVTRFPPEPNGYLHLGHAKSITLNFGLAQQYQGRCHLRFDDTNPVTEDTEYVEAIQADIRWLGFDWETHLYYASDYFEQMYAWAEALVLQGDAYVDDQSLEEIRASRGTVTEAGRPSPYRDRTPAENLELLRQMRAGAFPDGAKVLRARADMASSNMKMRDPLLYRIRHAHHHRTGDKWCIYPFYDYAHCLSDAIEGISHSLCTLEFENNRELYDWILEKVGTPKPRPQQIEFARLNLNYTVMSKRRLLALVKGGHVSGWDDPRMPTLAAARRRGIRPEALRAFAERVGVARANSVVDLGLLEHTLRDDLNAEAPRIMAVSQPLRVILENWPEEEVDLLDASYWPHDVPKQGSRQVPFGRELFIERSDFSMDPPKGFFRLAPGREVRLRYAYLITCTGVERDEAGEVIAVRATVDRDSRGGRATDGRKVRGTIHWVSAAHALPAELRLYDRLFKEEAPSGDPESLNPDSLIVAQGLVEPSVAEDAPETRYQFERTGYFWRDPVDSRPDRLVFNRIVPLKDGWARETQAAPTPPKAKAPQKQTPRRDPVRTLSPAQQQIATTLEAKGLSTSDAALLASEDGLRGLFDEALTVHDQPRSVANWLVNEVQAALKDRSAQDLPTDGAALGRLVALVDDQTISSAAGKKVLEILLSEGGDPATIVQAQGLQQLSDPDALREIIEGVAAAHPEDVARYQANPRLLGFFVGKVMAATGGRADPRLTQRLLREILG